MSMKLTSIQDINLFLRSDILLYLRFSKHLMTCKLT